MPINTPHPLYSANKDVWQKCRDAYSGEEAVKSGGTSYLPKVDSTQTSSGYDAYRTRASYYEAVSRTIDGFVGTMSRKSHTFVVPSAIDPLIADVTGDGMGLMEFTKKLCSEILLVARCGVLTDFSTDKNRAYLVYYPAEAIISWSENSVILTETFYQKDAADQHRISVVDQIRQLSIIDGNYTVTIWRKSKSMGLQDQWQIAETMVPTIRGKPMKEIPFTWLSSMGCTNRIEKPPLLGLINIALSHYRSSADLEHGRHFTALPTLYATGIFPGTIKSIGAGAVIEIENPEARVGYAEFTGRGLGSLEKALETKEAQMATLGAAVLTQQKAGVEAAETARIRTAGQTSLLSGVVGSVEESLTKALTIACDWAGAPGGVDVKLNREFVDNELDPSTLAGLVKAYQAGAISLETFLFSLQTSDMLPPEMDIKKEAGILEAARAARQKESTEHSDNQ